MADSKKPKNGSNKPKGSSSPKAKPPFSVSLYDDLCNDLSIIFLHDKTIQLLKSDKVFKETVEFYLNGVSTYESIKVKEPKKEDFLAAYKTIIGKAFEPKKLTKKEIEELDDKLNFLNIYIKNTIGEDWQSIVDSFSKNKKLPQEAKATSTKKQEQPKQEYTRPFDAEEFMRQNNMSMNQIADTVIAQQASFLLRKDIQENKFFQYSSKPSFFIWVKWTLFVAWVICALLIVINSFSFVSLGQSNYLFLFEVIQGLDASTQSIEISKLVNNGIIFQNQMGITVFGILMSLLLPGLIVFYAFSQIKNNKNENARFTCKTFITWFLILVLLMQFFPIVINQPSLFNFSRLSSGSGLNNLPPTLQILENGKEKFSVIIDQAKLYPLIMLKSISFILIFVVVGICTFLSIAIITTRPKLDVNRIQAKINEYVDDIKTGKIKFDQDISGGGFGSGIFGSGRNPFSPY